VAVGDLDGAPGAEIAAVIICDRGGVPWANSVQIYGPGPTLLASVTLSDLVPDAVGRAVVGDLNYDDGRLFIRWRTGQEGDGGCCSTLDAHARVHLSGTDLVVDEVESFPEGPAVERILAAVASGDRATLDQVSGGKPRIADALARLGAGATGFGSVTCRSHSFDADGNLVPSFRNSFHRDAGWIPSMGSAAVDPGALSMSADSSETGMFDQGQRADGSHQRQLAMHDVVVAVLEVTRAGRTLSPWESEHGSGASLRPWPARGAELRSTISE